MCSHWVEGAERGGGQAEKDQEVEVPPLSFSLFVLLPSSATDENSGSARRPRTTKANVAGPAARRPPQTPTLNANDQERPADQVNEPMPKRLARIPEPRAPVALARHWQQVWHT